MKKPKNTSTLKKKLDEMIRQTTNQEFNDEDEQDDLEEKDDLDDLDDKEHVIDYKFNSSQGHSSYNGTGKKMIESEIKKYDKELAESQKTISIEEYRKIVRENAELKDKELKYIETIKHLKN